MKWIKNVKLEIGNIIDGERIETKTGFYHIGIKDGKIAEHLHHTMPIPETAEEVYDAKEYLAIPTFKEMHNHLDKTYLSVEWKASKPVKNLKERLQYEAEELKDLAPTTKQRATAMIEEILSHGATHIRTHVNIDPYIGLKNLEGVVAALEEYKGAVTADIVAFPQHGLFNGSVPALMREAMRSGATVVGGLDPSGIDQNIEKSLYETMAIAAEFDAEVDIHLHDGGDVGVYTINKWLDIVEETKWKRASAISHAFCIGEIPTLQQQNLANRLMKNNVAIMSTIPLTKSLPPIELLDERGVSVHFGCDGFYDSWSPLGHGDLIEKVQKYCQITKRIDEVSLRDSLKWVTGGITPLAKDGTYQWPKKQDDASFIFVNATSSAEVVARRKQRLAVMSRGEFVFGELEKAVLHV